MGQTAQQEDFVIFLKESNLTAAQIAGGEDIPKADVVVKGTYEIEPLVRNREIEKEIEPP